MDILSRLFRGFIGVGVAVWAIQVVAVKYLPPPDCSGDLSHRLIDSRPPLTVEIATKVVRWLPDLYGEVLVGDMSVSGYLRGGPVCHPRSKFKVPEGMGPLEILLGDLQQGR